MVLFIGLPTEVSGNATDGQPVEGSPWNANSNCNLCSCWLFDFIRDNTDHGSGLLLSQEEEEEL